MKKTLALILALSLSLALASCGNPNQPSNSGTTSTPAASTGTTSTTTPPAGGSGETVTLATGGTSGTYYAYGGVMQTTLNPLLTTGQLNVTSTGASSANILEVADGNAQMSILQSDVLSYAHSGTDLFTEAETSSQWVAGLYNETVQLVTCDPSIQSMEDLKGKTIVTTGKGTTPEYVLRYILTENGVDPDNDVTLDFYSEATEALAQLQAGTSTIAMLPQPFVTSALAQVEGLRVALDMNEEWEKVAGSKLVTGVLVARKDAVEADPARFAAFMDGYKASVEAANTDLENTAALCEQYGIVAKAALAQKALPNCNIVFETGDEMKTDLETYFNVLYAADPTSVGGQLPADDFYYAG